MRESSGSRFFSSSPISPESHSGVNICPLSRIASSITFHSVFPLLHPPYMEDRKHRGSFFRPLSGIVCRCLFVCKSGNCLYRLAGCYPAWCPARHLRCRSLATHCPVLTSSASEDYVPDKKHKLRLLRSYVGYYPTPS